MKKTIKKLAVEKKLILKSNKGFFKFENFFVDPDAPDILAIISIRGGGKTVGAINLALEGFFKYGKRFVWLRRRKVEIDEIKNEFQFFDYFIWKGKRVQIFQQGLKLYVKSNNNKIVQCGWLCCLSTWYNQKSKDFKDVGLIVFDEFMSEFECYLAKEYDVFINVISTIERVKKGVKTILLGNNINPHNTYIQHWDVKINNEIEKYEVKRGNKKIWVINDRNTKVINDLYQDSLSYFLSGFSEPLNEYMTKGKFKYENQFICSKSDYRNTLPKYNFYLGGMPFHTRQNPDNNIIYLVEEIDKNAIKTYGMTQKDCHQQALDTVLDYSPLAENISRRLLNRTIFFSTVELFDLVVEWLHYYRPSEVL